MNFWCGANLIAGIGNVILAFIPPPFSFVNLIIGALNLLVAWSIYDS
jgi:uncharacterized membrane protein